MLEQMINPMLCSPFKIEHINSLENGEFIAEEKFDGERVLFFIDFSKQYFRIQNRYQFDKTKNYPEFTLTILKNLFSDKVRNCILDGELIAGSKSFNDLQRRSHLEDSFKIKIMMSKIPLKFVVFDVLMLNDKPTTHLKLLERKQILSEILNSQSNFLELSQIITEKLKKFFEEVVKNNGEGVIAKQVNSVYEFSRSNNWLKIKKKSTDTFKVLGWNERSGRGNYGSLKTTNGDVGLLSKKNKEEYDRLVKEVGLEKIWVEAEFQEKTKADRLRFPIFQRLVVSDELKECAICYNRYESHLGRIGIIEESEKAWICDFCWEKGE
jgi:ATP-dependent DNA ligase